jgi:hypothetical protein
MSTIRAHFDGKVFVPDEPVNCPQNVPLRLTLTTESESSRPLMGLVQLAETFPDDPHWPSDGAAEVDHYLYGLPKQGNR